MGTNSKAAITPSSKSTALPELSWCGGNGGGGKLESAGSQLGVKMKIHPQEVLPGSD